MSMEMWNPFNDVTSLPDVMNRLFRDGFTSPMGRLGRRRARGDGADIAPETLLPVDVYESDDSYTIVVSLPGVDRENIEIDVRGDRVTIRGEVAAEQQDRPDRQTILRERLVGRFARTLVLPIPVDADRAEAFFDQGVLTLQMPKAQQSRTHRIELRNAGDRQVVEGRDAQDQAIRNQEPRNQLAQNLAAQDQAVRDQGTARDQGAAGGQTTQS